MNKYTILSLIAVLAFVLAMTVPAADAATATLEMGQTQSIVWQAPDYQSDGVSVRIIRKVSDNPARYELVRTVSAKTASDGSAVWVPSAKDVGVNDFIQVGCLPSAKACKAGTSASPIAVIRSDRFLNTANAFEAIEQLNNR